MATGISFYFDEHMSRKVAAQLSELGYVVVMAVDEGMIEKDDLSEHLRFATEHRLVMVTCDRPFAGRAMSQTNHTGLICWTGVLDDFGGQVRVLHEFANQYTPEALVGRAFWIKAN